MPELRSVAGILMLLAGSNVLLGISTRDGGGYLIAVGILLVIAVAWSFLRLICRGEPDDSRPGFLAFCSIFLLYAAVPFLIARFILSL